MEINYDANYQESLLTLLISSPDNFSQVKPILKKEYFSGTMIPVVDYLLTYTEEYSRLPTPEQIKMMTGVDMALVDTSTVPNEAILDQTESFCRHRAIENVILGGVDLVSNNQYGEIDRQLKEAMTISLITDLGADYFNSANARIKRLKNKDDIISSGWKSLDRRLYGGFTTGSLNIFAGGSGSGKSLFLQNACLNWAMMGLNVIYITLELSEDLVGMRMDAMVTGMTTKKLFSSTDELLFRFNKTVAKDKPGQLRVKKMPEAGTTCNDLRAYIKQYQIKEGRSPDVLVVDYLDLLYPNNSRIDVTNAFAKDKYVSEELRSIGGDLGIPVLTASQLNRQSVEASEFDHSHIAGGISKINTADNVFGIFTTEAMRMGGKYQIQFLKTRSSSAVGSKMDLQYDPDCMRITDMPSEDIDEDLQAAQTAPAPKPAQQAPTSDAKEDSEEPMSASRAKAQNIMDKLRS